MFFTITDGVRIFRLTGYALSLILGLNGCQSTPKKAINEQEIKLVETSLEIVQNQIDQGKPEEALQTLKPIFTEYPDDTNVLNMMGITHLALNNPDKAKALLAKAYNLEPSPMISLNYSSALLANGLIKKARQILYEILENTSYEFKERVLHNIGYTYELENNVPQGIVFYKKALAENPVYYLSSLRLAKIYKKQRQNKTAVRFFQQASRNCPICLEPVLELTNHYSLNKSYGEAIQLLSNYLKLKGLTPHDKKQADTLLGVTRNLQANLRNQ